MGTNARQNHDNLDLLAKLNKLTDEDIDMMTVEDIRVLLKQLRVPARHELTRTAIIEVQARRVELTGVSTADLVGIVKTGNYPAA